MKNYKECNIVQDLLPNYVENLTSEGTNNYIEGHISECKECKTILEDMSKDIGGKKTEKNDKEVIYIKLYKKRLRMLRNVLLLIFAIIIFTIARKFWLLTYFAIKTDELAKSDNYYIEREIYEKGKRTEIDKTYHKDNASITYNWVFLKDPTRRRYFN